MRSAHTFRARRSGILPAISSERDVCSAILAIKRQNMKIMIMADNKREGKYIQRQLKSYGYFAEVVLEGAQGIEKSIKNSYDLILLDRMDGMILCKEMRSKISVPVILMSVKDSIDDKVS